MSTDKPLKSSESKVICPQSKGEEIVTLFSGNDVENIDPYLHVMSSTRDYSYYYVPNNYTIYDLSNCQRWQTLQLQTYHQELFLFKYMQLHLQYISTDCFHFSAAAVAGAIISWLIQQLIAQVMLLFKDLSRNRQSTLLLLHAYTNNTELMVEVTCFDYKHTCVLSTATALCYHIPAH